MNSFQCVPADVVITIFSIAEKEGRVISYCFNVILATVILCYIVRVYCEYQGCLGHFFCHFLIIFDC